MTDESLSLWGDELPDLTVTDKPVMAATKWRDNSEMILDARRLGYLGDHSRILDPTYQDGTWWKHWRPPLLVTNSLDAANGPDMTFDFRSAPFHDGTFDVVTYDPPYVSKGGRKTSTLQDHQRRYGIDTAPGSPRELQFLINTGLTEMTRVTGYGGIIFVKCQDYVSSGKLWNGSYYTQLHAIQVLGLSKLDQFYFLNNGSAQDKGRTKKCPACGGKGKKFTTMQGNSVPRDCPDCDGTGRVPTVQQHARVNVSICFVFKKGPA
jgi:hypothetical protein